MDWLVARLLFNRLIGGLAGCPPVVSLEELKLPSISCPVYVGVKGNNSRAKLPSQAANCVSPSGDQRCDARLPGTKVNALGMCHGAS